MKAHYNLHPVNIPECYDSFPDSFLLDTIDVMQMFNFSQKSGVSMLVMGGELSVSGHRDGVSQGKKNTYKLGDMRALRDKRNKQLEEL